MRHLLTGTLMIAALAAGSTVAYAQYDPPRYGRQGGPQYGPGGRYAPSWVDGIIRRVHADLNRSYEGGWRVSGGDRHRLDSAERELRDFARKWNRGHFDKGELDGAIASIQHVVDNNHLPPRDRDGLWQDLGELRHMREAYDRHELDWRR